jgi:GNAT superfamily N-acetyltransferase
MSLCIRDADFQGDREAMLAFIMGLQHFEHGFEPNRRLDPPVAEAYLAKLLDDVTKQPGRIFIAEDDGAAIGWAVVHEMDDDIYVVEAERRTVYISELYLVERARGTGAGRALIAACEEWARGQGVGVMLIGVLAGNRRAAAVYEKAGFGSYSRMLRKYL